MSAQPNSQRRPVGRTWQSRAQLAEHAKLLLSFPSTDPDASEATVSAALGTSRRELQRALAADGTTFRDEQMKERMARAERRLAEAEWPVARIALSCGYAHPPAFTRAFKRHHQGTTPRQWRAQHAESQGKEPEATSQTSEATDTTRLPAARLGELGVLLRRRYRAVMRLSSRLRVDRLAPVEIPLDT